MNDRSSKAAGSGTGLSIVTRQPPDAAPGPADPVGLARELHHGYRLWEQEVHGRYLRPWGRLRKRAKYPWVRFAEIVISRRGSG